MLAVVGALVVVVTDSSLVGNVVVPLALTGAEDEELTTAESVVGNNGGALPDGAGDVEASAVGVSDFSGSTGGFALVFSVAGCWVFTCCCKVWTNSLSDRTSSRSAWTSSLVAGVETAGEASGVWAESCAAAQTASATQIRFLIIS